jgi:DNA (cytosine-5)-methyltransferase 1
MNRFGVARLSPPFVEWMMGWPEGWVSEPGLGLSRAQQVRCCGEGVVPQQAEAALRFLLAREGVPHA